MTELQLLDRKRRLVSQIISSIIIIIKKIEPNKYPRKPLSYFAWVLCFVLLAHRQLKAEITVAKEADRRQKCYPKYLLLILEVLPEKILT